MNGPGNVGALGATPIPDARAQVRRLAHQLEGVFLNQLFQAMRASVPQDPESAATPGQEMFTQMFDERVAAQAADHMSHGLGEALYRQLSARLAETGTTEAK